MADMLYTIDLLPVEYRAREWLIRRLKFWTAVLLSGATLVGLAGHTISTRTRALEARVTPLREQVRTMESWSAMLEPLADKLNLARTRQLVVSGLLHEPQWTVLLADLSEASGDTIWLREMRVWKETGDETTDSRDQYILVLSGAARSNQEVIRFMTEVLRSSGIASLKLESSRTRQDRQSASTVDFNLRGKLQWH